MRNSRGGFGIVSLPELAINRPVSVVMIVITMLGLGVIAWNKIPLEFIPKMDFPYIGCWIPYPGATPEQVVNEIAIPAEGQFRTISHLQRITTNSDSDGCYVSMLFDWDADMGSATSEVRDRMERLRLELPSDIDNLFLHRHSTKSLPILALALTGEGDDEELAHRVRTRLQPQILRVDGVADVSVYSKPQKEILVEFDQGALRARNLGLYDVVTQLQSSSINVSVGEMKEGATKYYLRALGEFERPEEIGELVIGPNALRVKDVARVGQQAREFEQEFLMDGKGGAFMIVLKEAEANAVATCRAVLAALEEVKEDPDFKGMEIFPFFDQSEMIVSALDGLIRAGKYGGGLALVVLLLFLRKVRPTLVVAAAIPTAVVVSLVAMFFLDMTLNMITMASLVIALGMLVDNAIVVIENIYRYSQLGYDLRESSRRGATEVGMAITAATLTTVVVFVSMMYMDAGQMATYMREFALPVTVALGASLLIALTVIPLATSRMGELTHLTEHPVLRGVASLVRKAHGSWLLRPVALAGALRPLDRLLNGYASALAWVMRWRLGNVLLIIVIFAVTIAVPFRRVGQQGMPEIDTREVTIAVQLDQNFDMAMARETFELIGAEIDELREKLAIKNVFLRYSPTGGSIDCHLYQPEEYGDPAGVPYTTEQVLDILWQKLPRRVPGADFSFAIAESEGGSRQIRVRMRGDDTETLSAYVDLFVAGMEGIDKVSDVETDTERDTQEIQLTVDETLAEQFGVSPYLVARTVDFALRGTRLPYLKREGREISVWAQFREEDRKKRENLDNVAVLSPTGELVPLNRLVTLNKSKSAKEIRRINAKNVVVISAKVAGDDLAEVKQAIDKLAAQFDLPRGYTIEPGDMLMELDENMTSFMTGLVLAIVMIYLVMGALFESFILPLSILTSIPVAFVGVFWMMFFTGTPMDTISFIGSLLMVGVVVNNGIVIVDHINFLRKEGRSRVQAIVQAGRDRFRPVMMTALTTILGCVPLAMGGSGSGGEIAFYSLGRALIGGLTMGTVLTLFVVPLSYSLIDDLRGWLMQYFAGLAGLRGKRVAEAPGK